MGESLPLHGIRVCDFSWVGAGPLTTKFLSEHGAQVIRIESMKKPDELREIGPYPDRKPGINRSGYYANRNSNKLSLQLDMKHPRAKEILTRLIKKSDIVCNNFTPGVLDRWGFGYEVVRSIKPDIIYVEMPMQGSTGPHANSVGYGVTLNALSGVMGLAGYPDRLPTGTGTNFPDHAANPCHAAFAIIAALRFRRKTGQGQRIEVSQLESTINACVAIPVMDFANNGTVAMRSGNRLGHAAPQGVYRCRGEDRWLAISVSNDAEWQGLRRAMGDPAWAREEAFSTLRGRLEHHDELDEYLQSWTQQQDSDTLMQLLQSQGVPAGSVRDARDLIDTDPQLKAREHWVYLDHPEMGRSVYDATPFKLSGTPGGPRQPAPLLGQHTEFVCREVLGMGGEEYERYLESGVFV